MKNDLRTEKETGLLGDGYLNDSADKECSNEYIADLLLGLIRLTRTQNSKFLNYLLQMAHKEASKKDS